MKAKILEMLQLQDKMNSTVNPDWRNAGNIWTDAIMVEATEALDHYGWKWWKKQEPNIPAVKMELIDIWHFALSWMMVHFPITLEELADEIDKGISSHDWNAGFGDYTFRDHIRGVIGYAADGSFGAQDFHYAMAHVGLSFDELHEQYVAKNCLNIFRQAHGYKQGTYIKDWSEYGYAEDNDFLIAVMNSGTKPADVSQYDFLYSQLEEMYLKL